MSHSISDLLVERQRRRLDGLTMFRALSPTTPGIPAGSIDQRDIFKSDATELLIRGGNRAGKTVCTAALFAAIARDVPIRTWDGEVIECRRPWQKNRPLLMWVVGIQLNHIGQTIHRALFRAGLYKMIPDEITGQWRPYREWMEEDRERSHLCKPCPPLIPPSEIDPKGWAWENKAAHEFTKCTLKNGTEIYAFASSGEVKAGDPVDVIWIDERIRFSHYYPEWRMRLVDKRGRLIWSTKAYAGNPAMTELTDKARVQAEEVAEGVREKAHIVEIRLNTMNNPFLDQTSITEASESLSPEQIAERMAGDYETGQALIYPFFSKQLHAAIPAHEKQDDRIAEILRKNNGLPPNDWCHEFILDPGTQKPAGLFGAIPPPYLWEGDIPVLVVYDEIYGQRMDAAQMAQAVKEKTPPGRCYNRFIIDGQAARQTPMSFGVTVESNYIDEFTKRGVKPVGSERAYFIEGNPDFSARKMQVDQWMSLRDDGRPGVRVVIERCPHLVWQLINNHFAVNLDGMVDDKRPAPRQRDDVRDCLEYWVSRKPRFVAPPKTNSVSVNRWDSLQKFIGQRFGRQTAEKPYTEIGGSS